MGQYADVTYYKNTYGGNAIPKKELHKALNKASRHIDTLTYNRIVSKGILNLTAFQQETVRECCCELADFEYENADMLESVLQSYAVNGVSMSFGSSWNVKIMNGTAIRSDIYTRLSSTGLCCRSLGV